MPQQIKTTCIYLEHQEEIAQQLDIEVMIYRGTNIKNYRYLNSKMKLQI